MTTHDERVARLLKQAHEQVREHPDTPEARARTVAALEQAMATTPRGERARGPRWPLALAAGVAALLGVGLWSFSKPAPVAQVLASSSATLRVGQGLADATTVESGEGAVSLSLPRAVTVHLSQGSALQLREQGARVFVLRGEVAAEVTSLEQPFVLESGDTVVATRGARLKLKPGAGCDGHTAVEVSSGSVQVLLEGAPELKAGDTWPRCPQAAAQVDEAPAVSPLATGELEPRPAAVEGTREKVTPPSRVEPRPQPVRPHAAPPPTAPPPGEKTDSAAHRQDEERLARQNELYLQAVTLQRAGEVNLAVKKLDLLLEDERSPLAEAALTQKMKWLSTTDRARARAAARDYLQRFPMGFGRAEAETLVLEKP